MGYGILIDYVVTVLSIAPNDEDAIRCKIVALIKNDSIDEALSTMESSRKLQIDFSFFKVKLRNAYVSQLYLLFHFRLCYYVFSLQQYAFGYYGPVVCSVLFVCIG